MEALEHEPDEAIRARVDFLPSNMDKSPLLMLHAECNRTLEALRVAFR